MKSWIWTASLSDPRVAFRREFTIDRPPLEARLEFAAVGSFLILVNGEVVFSGPAPAPEGHCSLHQLDISFLMQSGRNSICALVQGAGTAAPGFCCILTADGQRLIDSDESWLALSAASARVSPSRGPGHGHCELHDLSLLPEEWANPDASDASWKPASLLGPSPGRYAWAHLQIKAPLSLSPLRQLVARGKMLPAAACLPLDVASLRRGGTILATASLRLPPGAHALMVVCDGEWALDIGGTTVLSGDGHRLVHSCEIDLPDDWVEVRLRAVCDLRLCGATLLFPGLRPDAVLLHQLPDDQAETGWLLAHLKVPFSRSYGISLAIPEFSPSPLGGADAAAWLSSFSFNNDLTAAEAFSSVNLGAGEYASLDLGRRSIALPQLQIEGSAGDVVDILLTEELNDGVPEPISHGIRRVDTLVLSGHLDTWTPVVFSGFRYVSIAVRSASGSVEVSNANVLLPGRDRDAALSSVDCSDARLKKVWERAAEAADGCCELQLRDAVSSPAGQNLFPSALLGGAGLWTGSDLSPYRQALLDFAAAQFETGEIPASFPCGDEGDPLASMMWIIWLQKHALFTGERETVAAAAPALRSLLDWCSRDAAPSGMILEDGGVNALVNALFCRALQAAAWLMEFMDDEDDAAVYRIQAEQVGIALRNLCWPEGGSDEAAYEETVAAIYAGILPEAQAQALFDRWHNAAAPFWKDDVAADERSPFHALLAIEAALNLERNRWAVDFIADFWTAEEHAPCSVFSSIPAPYLISELIGVRPAAPGFAQVFLNPLDSGVKSAKCRLQTPHGSLNVEWVRRNDGAYDFTINSSFAVDVISELPAELNARCAFRVNEEVSVMAKEK